MAQIVTTVLLGYGGIMVIGDSLVALLWPPSRRLGGFERIGLSLALGTGAISLFLFWGSLIAPGSVGVWWGVVPMLLLVAIRGWRSGWPAAMTAGPRRAWSWTLKAKPAPPSQGSMEGFGAWLRSKWLGVGNTDRWTLATSVILGAEITAFGATALATGYGWDGIAIWNLKARLAFVSGGMPLAYLQDISRQFSHLDYPWLLPLGQTWFYLVTGEFNEVIGKAIFLAFYTSLLMLFYASLAAMRSKPVALVFTTLLGSTPFLFAQATIGYADIAVTLYWSGSVFFMVRWLRSGLYGEILAAIALAAFAAWTKNEGLVYLSFQIGVVVCLWVIRRVQMRAREWAVMVAVVAAILAPWMALLAVFSVPRNDFDPITIGTAWANRHRLPVIGGTTVDILRQDRQWGYLWYIFGAASLLAIARGRNLSYYLYLLLCVTIPLAVLELGYVFSRWEPYTEHIAMSLDRLVLQSAPVAFLMVALVAADWLMGTDSQSAG